MYGIAKKLYAEREGIKNTSGLASYPLLDELYNRDCIDSIDISLAFQLAPENSTEDLYLLLCTLSQAVRQGHLCLSIDDDITPQNLFPVNVTERLKSAKAELSGLPIQIEGDCIYLPKYYALEKKFVQNFKRLISHPPTFSIKNPKLPDIKLLPEQVEAVKIACRHSLSVISGGPGTGKTFTAGVLIQTLWESFSPEQKMKARFVLAAPTGKAAMNLQKSFQRVCDDLKGFQPMRAQTLHSLLGIRPGNKKGKPIMEDVIIVDECSMIDVHIMAELLASVKDGARLIMLGDSHQLPPVEAGSLFTDMISLLDEVGELTHCIRVELQGIRDLSDAIYRGDIHAALSLLSEQTPGVHRLHFSTEGIAQQLNMIVEYAVSNQPEIKDFTPESIKSYCESFCLLSPLRRGLFGVDHLNQLIFEAMKDRMVHPIMITRNDARLGLFNGDSGVLVNGETALFLDEEGVRTLPLVLLPNFEFAYCLSVHKSQGSEYDHVGLLMPEGAEGFGREVFYTGVTRARRRVDIWGEDQILKETIEKKNRRHSGI